MSCLVAAPVPSPPPSSQDKDQLQKTTAVFHAGCPKVTPFHCPGLSSLVGHGGSITGCVSIYYRLMGRVEWGRRRAVSMHHSTPHYTTSLHTTLHYTTPLHSTLYHTTLHHTSLHHTTPLHTTLHTTLHHSTPQHTTLHCTTPHFTAPHYTTPHYTTPHHTTLHHTTPHFTTLHHTTPHHTTPHYTTLHHATPFHTTLHHLPCATSGMMIIPAGGVEELLKKQRALLKRSPKVTVAWIPQGGRGWGCGRHCVQLWPLPIHAMQQKTRRWRGRLQRAVKRARQPCKWSCDCHMTTFSVNVVV